MPDAMSIPAMVRAVHLRGDASILDRRLRSPIGPLLKRSPATPIRI